MKIGYRVRREATEPRQSRPNKKGREHLTQKGVIVALKRRDEGSSSPSYIWKLGNTKCGKAFWWRMAWTNGEADLSSNAHRVGSWLLGGVGVMFVCARFLSSTIVFRLN